MIIAVDGPTASGKGTIAKALAAHFGLPHLDTGLLYRAVGRQVFLDGGDPDNGGDALAGCAFPDTLLNDPQLRDEETGGLASRVSVHPPVRQALFARQRKFAEQAGGAVLDGDLPCGSRDATPRPGRGEPLRRRQRQVQDVQHEGNRHEQRHPGDAVRDGRNCRQRPVEGRQHDVNGSLGLHHLNNQ